MENFEAFLENLLEHTPLISEECRLKRVLFLVGDFCTNPQTLTPFPFFKED